jgi:hypothetical protein
MAHAKDRKFQEIYVDRRAGAWGEMPIDEKAGSRRSAVTSGDFSWANQNGGLVCALPNQALGTADDQ